MSRQNKNAKRVASRKHFTSLHKRGEKGPTHTKAVHGKVNTLRRVKRKATPIGGDDITSYSL